jgi:hypothetical protein
MHMINQQLSFFFTQKHKSTIDSFSSLMYYSSIVSSLALASSIHCHAILTTPKSRTSGTQMSFSGIGVKIATFPPPPQQLNSCLDSTRQPSSLTVSPGSQTTVEWAITLPHSSDPGVRVALLDPKGGPAMVLVDNVNVNDLKTTVTFPAALTPGPAVMQWIWASKDDGGFYMACSDITVAAAGAKGPASLAVDAASDLVSSAAPGTLAPATMTTMQMQQPSELMQVAAQLLSA